MSRVLMVADGLWNGGAERQLALLSSHLPTPWSASVIAMEDGPYRPVFEGLGVELVLATRGYRFDVSPAWRMWRTAARIRPDIVHSWGWMSTLAMVPYCRIQGIPLLAGTIRRGDVPGRRGGAYRLGMGLADAVAANSRAGLAAFDIAEGARGHVVYNGFDPARLASIPTGATQRDPDAPTVAVMAARMSESKDWRLLIQAARTLSADGAWRFIAMGDGPDRAALRVEAADLIDSGVMQFPEPGLEVLPTVASSDIGVLLTDPTYLAEGCSNAIMEFMACGRPVVATDSGGNRELVTEGVSGMLVPPRDAAGVVAALRSLAADPDRARAMGSAGRARLERDFTVPAMTAGFVDIYEGLLRARARTAS
jgi:glycosyltransferase involved in cell wall biosynthesis